MSTQQQRELWKSRYVNSLNQDCGMAGYSDVGRPLVKNQWTKIKWEPRHLDDNVTKYCCYKKNDLDTKEPGTERKYERALCMNCANWLDKYHRELNTREAEERGMDSLVPLLEKIIENQEILSRKVDDMCESLATIARNTGQ
jgi:hypothetical protein